MVQDMQDRDIVAVED